MEKGEIGILIISPNSLDTTSKKFIIPRDTLITSVIDNGSASIYAESS